MIDIQLHQENIQLLLIQRSLILNMSQDKQDKYLIKINAWILEISELVEEELKQVS